MEPRCCKVLLGAILDSTEGGRHGTAHVVHQHHAGPPSLRPRLDPRHAHVFRAPPTHCSAVGGTAHAPLLPAVRFACRAVALAPRRRPPAQAPRARQHCCSSSGQSHQVHARRAERDLAGHAGRSKTVVGSVPALLFLRRAPKITKMRGVSKEAGVCCAVGGGLVRARPPPTLLTSGCASVPCAMVFALGQWLPRIMPCRCWLRVSLPASAEGTWCSGITSASHVEGPGFKSQCVHFLCARCFCAPPRRPSTTA